MTLNLHINLFIFISCLICTKDAFSQFNIQENDQLPDQVIHKISIQSNLKLPIFSFAQSLDYEQLLFRHLLGWGVDVCYSARIRKKSPFYLSVFVGYDHFIFDRSTQNAPKEIVAWYGNSTQFIRTMFGIDYTTRGSIFFSSSIHSGIQYIIPFHSSYVAWNPNGILKVSHQQSNGSINLCVSAQAGIGIQCSDRIAFEVKLGLLYSTSSIQTEIQEFYTVPFSNQLINPNFTIIHRNSTTLMSILYTQLGLTFNYRFYYKN